MTTFDRDPLFDPRISDWLEADPDRAPEVVLETVTAAFPSIPQRRAWRVPWRFPFMLTPARVAVAAVIGVLLVGGVLFTLGREPAVGVPGPSTSPSPVTSPTSSSAITPVRMPAAVLGDWQAVADAAIFGVNEAAEGIQFSLEWQEGQSAWIQPAQGELSLHSTSIAAAPDELRFVSTERLGGCTPGDEGRYGWTRSADGLFLTLTVVEESCPTRAAAFGRTWVHSLNAVNDGGSGVIPFDPWIGATLPSRQWGMSGATDGPVIAAFGTDAPDIEFVIIRNPMGFDAPCSADRQAVPIDHSAAAIEAYVRGLPGVTVTSADAAIDGRSAVHLTIESDAAIDCPVGEIMAFHPPLAAEDGEYTMALGESRSFWIVELDGDAYILWYAGQGVTAADETAVIESVQFLDRLPKP